MLLINRLQVCILAGITFLPLRVILSLFDLEGILFLVAGLQGVFSCIVISCLNDKLLDKLLCFITFIIAALLSLFLGNIIYDIISGFTSLLIMELHSVIKFALLHVNGNKLTLSMNIADMLNPEPSVPNQAVQPQGNIVTTCNDTGLDVTDNQAFANSLENRIMAIANSKTPDSNGRISVKLRDLNMRKTSPSYNLLVNIMADYDKYTSFEKNLQTSNYRSLMI